MRAARMGKVSEVVLEKLRYLSLSEETMKNMMDCGVLTVGGFVQFTAEVDMLYAECLVCLNKLVRKYEQLQINTVYDATKKKFYWARMAPEHVHTTADLGTLSETEAQSRFNDIVKEGIKDGGPIWKFFFAKVSAEQCSSTKAVVSSKNTSSSMTSSGAASADITSSDVRSRGVECERYAFSSSKKQWGVGNDGFQQQQQQHRYIIFFVLSHALVDGIGMMTIVRDFSTFVCQMLERKKIHLSDVTSQEEDESEALKMCPPYEQLVPNLRMYKVACYPLCLMSDIGIRILFKFRCVPTASHSLFNSTRLKPLTREGSGGGECRLRTECIRFTPEEWTNFQKFRRQNGLTVTGLGLALFGVALMKYAYEGLNWPRTYLGAHVLRDPRLYFKKGHLDPGALVGNYIAAGLLLVLPFVRKEKKKPVRKIVTDTATLITQQIRGNFKNFGAFFNGELQSRISRNRKLVERAVDMFSNDKRSEGRFAMIQFSNVGEVNCLDPELCGDYRAVQVEKSIGVADQSKCGDCFCLILATVQGSLFWSIGYPGHLYSEETVRALGQELKQLWTEVIQPDPDLPQQSDNSSASVNNFTGS